MIPAEVEMLLDCGVCCVDSGFCARNWNAGWFSDVLGDVLLDP